MVRRAATMVPGVGAIKTRADHQLALKEIERLMDAKPNTSAGRRLEALVRLVDAYESRTCPIEPPTRSAAREFQAESRRSLRTHGAAKTAARKSRHR